MGAGVHTPNCGADKLMKRLLSMLTLVFFATSVIAIDSGQAFDDPDLQARYEKLIAEVRCVTCQNQNIKDSS
ncbi:MAG: cytochrome c-type biogenesis protein, partial [Woeseiales bacterium]